MQDIYERARRIRVAIFDVDGVLTDGALYYTDTGGELKAFSVHDGHGMRMLRESGVALAIISSRSSRSLEARARNLGIELLFQGAADKLAAFGELLGRCDIGAEACACVGDDLVDVPVMKRCGLAVAVPDAPALVRRRAQYVTRARGGHGAAREFCEIILHAQGSLAARLADYGDQ
ncbi:MAG TPA: HAD-IIIA family hydrolase [Burkholderiales bacterium]|nr:HAD-IIIA family hydrolase [Burkholderiales bacterium]